MTRRRKYHYETETCYKCGHKTRHRVSDVINPLDVGRGPLAVLMEQAQMQINKIHKVKWAEVVIRDLGPLAQFLSVTNAAEETVRELSGRPRLDGRRLFYYDSNGKLNELKVKNGEFAGFAPGGPK